MFKSKPQILFLLLRILQGILIGLGAVLPGISGGVMCVAFGLYQPVIETLANPLRGIRKHKCLLLPLLSGTCLGFLGVSRLVSNLLVQFPHLSVCLFIGLMIGSLPSFISSIPVECIVKRHLLLSLASALLYISLVLLLQASTFSLKENMFWFFICGCALSISIILPGLSFSSILMPLGLYQVFLDGVSSMKPSVILPSVLGAGLTILLLSDIMSRLLSKHLSAVSHFLLGLSAASILSVFPWNYCLSTPLSALSCLFTILAGGTITYTINKQHTKRKTV